MNRKPIGPKEPVFTPAFDAWPDAGVYRLWLRLRRPVLLHVGSLGWVQFRAGMYVYTGRAARGLRARVLRHVRGGRRRHWHIDYLLRSSVARVRRVVLASTDPDDECAVNCELANEGSVAVPRFGASDCRSGCPAHLWFMG